MAQFALSTALIQLATVILVPLVLIVPWVVAEKVKIKMCRREQHRPHDPGDPTDPFVRVFRGYRLENP